MHWLLAALAGQLVVSLFVFIHRLDYTNGCLSSIFYVAAVGLVAQDTHVGSKMNAAAFVIGPLWFGSIIAGCMVSQTVCQDISTCYACIPCCADVSLLTSLLADNSCAHWAPEPKPAQMYGCGLSCFHRRHGNIGRWHQFKSSPSQIPLGFLVASSLCKLAAVHHPSFKLACLPTIADVVAL